MARLARISLTPVKGLRLQHPAEAELGADGVDDDRRFYLIAGGRLFNGARHGPLVAVRARYREPTLTLLFPGGEEVTGEVAHGAPVQTDFWGRPVDGRVVVGPWAAALSAYAGTALELVEIDRAGTGSDVAVGTLVGRASCERLAGELGHPVDPRRFRMLLELDGLAPHEEDSWSGTRVAIGAAVVRVGGPVPRCAVTTQDPDSGAVTLETLRGIRAYRGLREGRFADFGVYFAVEQPGRVRVGDPVEPLAADV